MSAEELVLPDDNSPIQQRRARVRARAWRWVLISLAALAIAALALWTQRRPIAADVIDQKLAAWHVPARYKIADLGLRRQRLTNVVIGDPANPDLVADWISVDTSLSLSGAQVVGLRAGHVRVRGRMVGGTLTLGSLDRLLPAPSGKPFTLPDIAMTVDDARMRLETPQGIIGLKLAGNGPLNDGFKGTMAAVSDRLTSNGCDADHVTALVNVTITASQPYLDGPVKAANLRCAGVRATGLVVDQHTGLGTALDRWQGNARVKIATLHHPRTVAQGLAGNVRYTGSAAKTDGAVDLDIGVLAGSPGIARSTKLSGRFQLGSDNNRFDGTVSSDLTLARHWQSAMEQWRTAAPGTPAAPLLQKLGAAGMLAMRAFTVTGNVAVAMGTGHGSLSVTGAAARSASGAVMTLSGGQGIRYRWGQGTNGGKARVDGLLALAGGNLPNFAVLLTQDAHTGVVRGAGLMRNYRSGGAELALSAIDFRIAPGGATRFTTRAMLSGPLGDGRVVGASLPVSGSWDGAGRFVVNSTCAPLAIGRLTLGGLDLKRTRVTLCPTGAALFTWARGKTGGGGRVDHVRLAGMMGDAPLTLDAQHAEFGFAANEFALAAVKTRLGTGDFPTILDIARLNGHLKNGIVIGNFSGGAGRIANVPLLMSAAAGNWGLEGGKLSVDGGMMVADADNAPRFKPLSADGVKLTLLNNRIVASGTLNNPATGAHVTDVRIVHDLSNGTGSADLDVPGITFGTRLQPDQLTSLTYGVIANVIGSVSGEGHVRWTREGVTSDGVFRTVNADLAAAFGPVTGLSTEIRFTDLLNMVSAPNQIATVAVVNPGVAVENGVVRYALQAGQKVEILGAEWPFAGGRLILEPTLLNFTEHHERRLPFRVENMDAAQFLQQFDFKNLDATGTFDGGLPMIFSDRGGRIERGHLKVRPGGGTIAYVGELSQKNLGFWGNMAFQSLKSLKYRELELEMNGPLDGEVITDVRFSGVSQGKGTKSNFLIKRLARLPLVFNVRIQAPFRQLLDSAQSFYDPSRLIQRNLPALIKAQEEAQRRARADAQAAAAAASLPKPAQPIQPPESEKRP